MLKLRAVVLAFLLTIQFGSVFGGDAFLEKEGKPLLLKDASVMEVTPFTWNGRPCLLASVRPFASSHESQELRLRVLSLDDLSTLSEFGVGCSLASAIVEKHGDQEILHVYAARQPEGETWFRDIVSFTTDDLNAWTETTALEAENEHLLNSSVCRDGEGYLMAYESDSPVSFCFKFARSQDLIHWEKTPDLFYAGRDGATYSACPVVRKHGDYYYFVFLRQDGKGGYESALIRSRDLRSWEESPYNPILSASEGEGINNSDVDLFEHDGRTQVFYATGDQQGWCDVRRAFFDGTEREFFERAFETPRAEGVPSRDADPPFGFNAHTGDSSARVDVYVSKLGDDSDGKSWKTAYRSVQRALENLPDSSNGVRVIVRPDRYFEPNLLPARSGAKDAYNELVGDYDGKLGSGATGWVYLDSSDPEKGFKSYDWHSTIRAYMQGWSTKHTGKTVSSCAWDRWIVRRIYATGGDAGLFWDCLQETTPFTILVEDCVSIGRAFGIGVAFGAFDPQSPSTRDDEPIVFRHVWACSLDRWGDAGAAFLRSCRPTLAERPEFYLEDCTLVSPDNAIENNCAVYEGSTHVALKDCRLIVWNFTQPQGDPQCTGVIRTPNDGSRYLIELENCELMGCKLFSDEQPAPPQYRLKGLNRAYVQFNNPVPEGMEAIQGWPVELFQCVAPPK